jgi:hypothetical protein
MSQVTAALCQRVYEAQGIVLAVKAAMDGMEHRDFEPLAGMRFACEAVYRALNEIARDIDTIHVAEEPKP